MLRLPIVEPAGHEPPELVARDEPNTVSELGSKRRRTRPRAAGVYEPASRCMMAVEDDRKFLDMARVDRVRISLALYGAPTAPVEHAAINPTIAGVSAVAPDAAPTIRQALQHELLEYQRIEAAQLIEQLARGVAIIAHRQGPEAIDRHPCGANPRPMRARQADMPPKIGDSRQKGHS